MTFFANFCFTMAGFILGFVTAALMRANKYGDSEEEQETKFIPRSPPRAHCMPPGCNDYPECNHRY